MSQQPPSYPSSTPPPGGYGPPHGGYGPPQGGYGPPPATEQFSPLAPPPLGGGTSTGPNTGTNTMAVLSVVFAFVFSPLGIVFGIVGRRQTGRSGLAGRGLATTGLVLSVVFLIAGVAAALYVTVLATQLVPWGVTSTPDVPGVSAPAVPTGPDQAAPDPDPGAPVVTGPVGTATVGVANGDYGPEVPSDALAQEVGARTGATDVICPGYLPAQVDASTTCAGALGGQQAQLQTRVTAVEGSAATVDIARVG